ncbi:MAG: DUF4097 domain-containing protein [Lachnospiraceae bacterium]|nr:DUF4097 domain-containing protein [Lachnospiraceae bacterium]
MKRTTVKIFMVILSFVTVFCILFGLWLHTGIFGEASLEAEVKTVDLEGEISNINIDMDACDFSIVYGDGLYAEYKYPKNYYPKFEVKDDTLFITDESKTRLGFNTNNAFKLTLTVPENTEFGTIKGDLDAGNIELNDIVCDELKVDADAGNIEFDNIKAEKMKLTADAGNIELNDITADYMVAAVDLGNIELHNVDIPLIEAGVDLGNIEFDGIFDKIDATCSLGNISVETEQDEDDLDLNLECTGNVQVNGKKW